MDPIELYIDRGRTNTMHVSSRRGEPLPHMSCGRRTARGRQASPSGHASLCERSPSLGPVTRRPPFDTRLLLGDLDVTGVRPSSRPREVSVFMQTPKSAVVDDPGVHQLARPSSYLVQEVTKVSILCR